MRPDFHVPADWYEQFFTGPVNAFWEAMVPPEVTEAELAFVLRHLRAHPPARVLDMPCGAGRHALALAERGYRVTGVDLSEEALARAAARSDDLPVRFVRADMRGFTAETPFDAALCLGNSAGYFDAEGTAAFFSALATGLRRGGRLILDSSTCAESVFPLAKAREITFARGTYTSRYAYDPLHSLLKTDAELVLDGDRHRLFYAHHILTSGALVHALGEAGLETLALYGGTDDAPFEPGSPRLLLVAEKR